MTNRKTDRNEAHMQVDRQADRKTLPLELTALWWWKSLPHAFFVLTKSGRFNIGAPQKTAK